VIRCLTQEIVWSEQSSAPYLATGSAEAHQPCLLRQVLPGAVAWSCEAKVHLMECDRLRGLMGFPVDYEMGHALHTHGPCRGEALFNATKDYVVKIVCKNAASEECGFFNGFFYHDTEPYIITTAHIIGFEGASQYLMMLFDGTRLSEEYAMEVVKCNFALDVAVFRCVTRLPHPPSSKAAVVGISHMVLAVGHSDAQLTFNEGKVTHLSFDGTFSVSTYADAVFSGAPIFNMDGYFVGMVKSGEGTYIKQPVCVGATKIHNALVSEPHPLPGLH